MNIPVNLKYTKTDEWVKVDGTQATVGISDYAQGQLSDIVYCEITATLSSVVSKGVTCATVESVKAAADITLPVSGKISEINSTLGKTPEIINTDPYGAAWMLKVEMSNPAEVDLLMDAKAYEAYCKERSH
jgi:glycine cleavage system H protein